MLRTSVRRVVAALGTTIITAAATLAVTAAPAQAAASGNLLNKGAGTLYSEWQYLNLGAVPGGNAATFFHKIVNTGSSPQQFKVVVFHISGNFTETLYTGSTPLPKTWYTPLIQPGGSLVLNVKATVPAGTLQSSGAFYFSLRDPETNLEMDFAYGNVHITPQTGTKRNDLFLKTGSQPYVGGSFSSQYETSAAIKVGGTATFLLRLKNDGSAPSAIGLSGGTTSYCPGNFTATIRQGTKNVTAAVVAGTYNTGTLAPGAKKELKVQIKLVSATSCRSAYYAFTSSGPDSPVTVNAQALVAS